MKVAIYARVSTSDGRQHTDNQVDELVAWAARLGHEVTQVYCDRVTGTKAAEERPALAEALRDAHERRYDVLLCWALDRLSRGGIGATAAILARLKGAGVGLRSYKESWLDTSTPAIGELLTAVFAWVPRQEADRIRDRQFHPETPRQVVQDRRRRQPLDRLADPRGRLVREGHRAPTAGARRRARSAGSSEGWQHSGGCRAARL